MEQSNKLESIDFTKVETLEVRNAPSAVFKGILKTAKALKAIVAVLKSRHEIKETVSLVIKQSKLLEYLQIDVSSQDYDEMIEAIEQGLFDTKQRKRNYLEIGLRIPDRMDMNRFMVFIGRIVNSLSIYQILENILCWHSMINLEYRM